MDKLTFWRKRKLSPKQMEDYIILIILDDMCNNLQNDKYNTGDKKVYGRLCQLIKGKKMNISIINKTPDYYIIKTVILSMIINDEVLEDKLSTNDNYKHINEHIEGGDLLEQVRNNLYTTGTSELIQRSPFVNLSLEQLPKISVEPIRPLQEGDPWKLILKFTDGDKQLINTLRQLSRQFYDNISMKDVRLITDIEDLNRPEEFINVEKIRLSNSNLDNFNYFLGDRVVEINISYNNIKEIPPLPPLLKYFKFTFNDVHSLPPLKHLTKLKMILGNYNDLQQVPELPQQLEIVDFSNNPLVISPNIPKKAKIFRIYENGNIINIPDSFSNSTLRLFNVKESKIENLPPPPPTLITLIIHINEISILPSLKNTQLQNLQSRFNDLFQIPELPKTINLIDVSINRIAYLSRLTFSNLEYVNISQNSISEISLEFLQSPIKVLICDNNLLQNLELPDDSKLEVLEIGHNPITWIGNRNNDLSNTKLEYLSFEDTNMTVIPKLPNSIKKVIAYNIHLSEDSIQEAKIILGDYCMREDTGLILNKRIDSRIRFFLDDDDDMNFRHQEEMEDMKRMISFSGRNKQEDILRNWNISNFGVKKNILKEL